MNGTDVKVSRAAHCGIQVLVCFQLLSQNSICVNFCKVSIIYPLSLVKEVMITVSPTPKALVRTK